MKVKEAIFDDETMLFALSIVKLLVYISQWSQVLFRICYVHCFAVRLSLCHNKKLKLNKR
jgi:hypothetical protein